MLGRHCTRNKWHDKVRLSCIQIAVSLGLEEVLMDRSRQLGRVRLKYCRSRGIAKGQGGIGDDPRAVEDVAVVEQQGLGTGAGLTPMLLVHTAEQSRACS